MSTGNRLAIAIATLVALCGCVSEAKENAKPSPAVAPAAEGQVTLSEAAQRKIQMQIQPVSTRAITATLEATGKLATVPDLEAHITIPVTGRMLKIYKRLGDHVEKGTALAMLESPDLGQAQSDFLQAEAQRRLKKEAFDRQQGLFDKQYAAKKDLAQAKSDYMAAGIEYERAQNKLLLLGMTRPNIGGLAHNRVLSPTLTIYASIPGTVTSKTLTLGEMIQAGNSIYTIDDMSKLWAMADIHELDLTKVRKGAHVQMTAAAYGDRLFEGVVDNVSESLATDTHTAKARIVVANSAGALKPEMYVNVKISSQQAQTMLAVPATAVILDGKERVVYVAKDKERFLRQAVEVGPEAGGWIGIRKGLHQGERVIAQGALLVNAAGKGD